MEALPRLREAVRKGRRADLNAVLGVSREPTLEEVPGPRTGPHPVDVQWIPDRYELQRFQQQGLPFLFQCTQ